MIVRSVGLGAMFGWVLDAFRLLARRPGTATGAAALTFVFGLLVAAPIYVAMFLAMRSGQLPGAGGAASLPMMAGMVGKLAVGYGLTLVLALILHPPITAGWFRLCRAVDQGAPARAVDIFQPFYDGATWLRVLLYTLLVFVLALVVVAMLVFAFRGVFGELAQGFALRAAGGGEPGFPDGLITAYAVSMIALVVLEFVALVGFGEVALRQTSPLAALGGAFSAVLRNALKLIVFALCMAVVLAVVMVLLGLLFGVVIFAVSALAPQLSTVLVFVLEIPLMLVLYPVIFNGAYHVWKSLLGGDDTPPSAPETVAAMAA